MREYSVVKVVYKDKETFLIWYLDDEDGFLSLEQKLLMFKSDDEARVFAKEKSVELDAEIVEFDISHIFEQIDRVELSENCNELINTWNLFSDIAKSLGEEFSGDIDEGLTNDIYHMLFSGCNLKVMKHEEYHPVFDDEDKEKCLSIFKDGLAMLDRQFDVFYAQP